jgi:2TM domain-containing protein
MATISLPAYEEAELALANSEARRGITVHAIITLVVSVVLVAVNILFVAEFPWSAFAVAGMVIGLGFHYYFGFLRVGETMAAHQQKVERMAASIR